MLWNPEDYEMLTVFVVAKARFVGVPFGSGREGQNGQQEAPGNEIVKFARTDRNKVAPVV